jgi:hypothetical protein
VTDTFGNSRPNNKVDSKGLGSDGIDSIHFSRHSPLVGSCEHGDEHSCSVEGREFLEHLIGSQILKKESAQSI